MDISKMGYESDYELGRNLFWAGGYWKVCTAS